MRFEVAGDAVMCEALLFRDVQNAIEIRAKLLAGELDAAVINANLILDMFQVRVAANSAAEKFADSSLCSRNINTEILYNLSATRNIGKALTIFGTTATSTYALVVIMNATPEKVASVRDVIAGKEVDDVEHALRQYAEKNRICAQYDIGEKELISGSLLDSVVTRMACRDVL